MDRREFLKVTGAGALTLFLSGCGINAVSGDKKAGAAAAQSAEAKPGGVSQGKKLKIVVLCGSPHRNGTSALLADKFIEGAKASGMKCSGSTPLLKIFIPVAAVTPAA